MAKSTHYYIRKSHRFLGLFLGIQFLMWTIGGLYFSWSNMDEIHGDLHRNQSRLFPPTFSVVSPSVILDSLRRAGNTDSILSVQLIDILGKPAYQIITTAHSMKDGQHHRKSTSYLADGETGIMRAPLSREEAIVLASQQFSQNVPVKKVDYFVNVPGDHEYRDNPLPAYAIEFDHPSHTRVYVATELGVVSKFRNEKWRIFDFLWMLHSMDYQGRDNIGNLVLRSFSILGLITVISGFLLFFYSSRSKQKRRYR